MSKNYEPKAKVQIIKATSRASIKVGDHYYTIEYGEERVIPDIEGVNITEERNSLWEDVNNECDTQAEIIIKTYGKNS